MDQLSLPTISRIDDMQVYAITSAVWISLGTVCLNVRVRWVLINVGS